MASVRPPRPCTLHIFIVDVQLELQFEDRAVQFTVAPVHAAIIMKFQEQTSWTSKSLAASIGIPVDVLNRRINFWISKGILAESLGADSSDHVFTLMEGMIEASKNSGNSGSFEDLVEGDEDGERSVVSAEDQLRREMIVYEILTVSHINLEVLRH
ncbi:anaphase-promoting complex subunit 2-like [Alnus glutinosa]|uniref:anaphase-promoting complex subunit 2-like n=1 Tax=Alnus glutinosa TaxID=3517 RepID=UPI002D7672A5|nr:anaphase-promoting complex subunit 2-like [Alnus glutinosa]